MFARIRHNEQLNYKYTATQLPFPAEHTDRGDERRPRIELSNTRTQLRVNWYAARKNGSDLLHLLIKRRGRESVANRTGDGVWSAVKPSPLRWRSGTWGALTMRSARHPSNATIFLSWRRDRKTTATTSFIINKLQSGEAANRVSLFRCTNKRLPNWRASNLWGGRPPKTYLTDILMCS